MSLKQKGDWSYSYTIHAATHMATAEFQVGWMPSCERNTVQ